MLRSILLLAAITVAAPSTQAVQPADQTYKAGPNVLKITWVSDLGGNRFIDVTWDSEPSIKDIANVTKHLETLSTAEGYTLTGKSDVAKGDTKSDRRITIGYSKTPSTGVLTKLSFKTQAAGTVIYNIESAGKHDEASLKALVEGIARDSARAPITDKVTVKTEIALQEGKKGTVTVVFKGGTFDLLK
ncbi:MAG: hypothetical protein KBC95_01745 [Candidatus Peribacteraceae bacterium]|nr:hypothetical protein [Candidatus Peribacteraceae bacterium]